MCQLTLSEYRKDCELSHKMVTVKLLFFFIRKSNTYTTCLVGGCVAEALRRVYPPLTTHAPGKWRGEKRLCLGIPMFGFQCCVAPDKAGTSLSFSFVIPL